MTRNEFLQMLSDELKKRKIADADDIVSEYEQHFAFKMADGFSEEEIAAKLGNPAALAAQFENVGQDKKPMGSRAIAAAGLFFADLFAVMFLILLIGWEIVMAAFSACCAAVAASLFAGVSPWSLIPPMPYGCGFIFGLSLAGLSVLSAVGCVYFAAFIRQLMRAYGRFHHNTMAAASGNAVLPSLSVHPRLNARTNRRLRAVALFSLTVFAAFIVLGMIVSMIVSGALAFWHAWGWFGYPGR